MPPAKRPGHKPPHASKPEPDQRLQAMILGFILVGAAMILFVAIAML